MKIVDEELTAITGSRNNRNYQISKRFQPLWSVQGGCSKKQLWEINNKLVRKKKRVLWWLRPIFIVQRPRPVEGMVNRSMSLSSHLVQKSLRVEIVRQGLVTEPITMTMSWSMRLVVCKSTKNSWASCATSKPCRAERKSCLVVDAMIVKLTNVAREFNEQLEVTGVILTKIDKYPWCGRFLSVRLLGSQSNSLVLVKKITDIETFHPDRMSGRILSMGDMLTLIEKEALKSTMRNV